MFPAAPEKGKANREGEIFEKSYPGQSEI